jgi:hypothetical protein
MTANLTLNLSAKSLATQSQLHTGILQLGYLPNSLDHLDHTPVPKPRQCPGPRAIRIPQEGPLWGTLREARGGPPFQPIYLGEKELRWFKQAMAVV